MPGLFKYFIEAFTPDDEGIVGEIETPTRSARAVEKKIITTAKADSVKVVPAPGEGSPESYQEAWYSKFFETKDTVVVKAERLDDGSTTDLEDGDSSEIDDPLEYNEQPNTLG